MKLSFISSNAIQNAMRTTIRESQNQMSDASIEATTGVYADIGVSLGGKTAQSIDMTRDQSRIDSILQSNSLANSRLTTSQNALADMSTSITTFRNQLLALQGNQDSDSINLSIQTASDTMSSFLGDANMMINGEYIFAGTNTDVQPMTDNSAAATTAIQSALTNYMAAQTPPVASAADLTGDQMTDFITNTVEPMFTSDASWADWSSASDQNMTSRINNSEVVTTSTNTNDPGMRYLALTTTMISALAGTPGLSKDALTALTTQAIPYATQAIDGLNSQTSALGLSQSRLSKANDALNAQKNIINNGIVNLQGVDPYEASTQVNSLETQLETAYTIVSKIQQLSLVNYL